VANSFSWAVPNGFDESMFSSVLAGPEKSEEFFKKWTQMVKDTIPQERLLIFEVKQGKTSPFCLMCYTTLCTSP
jgi:hypothetical protein